MFKENPIFFPDIALDDFAIKLETNSKSDSVNYDEKSEALKKLSYSELLDSIVITGHARPEYLNKSTSMNVMYQFDTMFNIMKRKDNSESASKHKYFYFLAEFFKLFEESISRYIVDKVIFYECFR
ncbi:MAG: hypothetical protein GY823_01710 [Flavobacteriaceae bacterium]|nr:hypothetical protein [Flavobacteriaceae bacterium]